jgi:hypothetical protein
MESERANTFSANDQKQLEECAEVALPLWIADYARKGLVVKGVLK